MRSTCVRLVDYFIDSANSANTGNTGDTAIGQKDQKRAVQFVLTGIRLGNQLRIVEKESLSTLCSDKSFSSTLR